jgi:hypothetical protein
MERDILITSDEEVVLQDSDVEEPETKVVQSEIEPEELEEETGTASAGAYVSALDQPIRRKIRTGLTKEEFIKLKEYPDEIFKANEFLNKAFNEDPKYVLLKFKTLTPKYNSNRNKELDVNIMKKDKKQNIIFY